MLDSVAGKKVREIPFSPPDITDAEIEEVIKAMKSGWITTGPRTRCSAANSGICQCAKGVCLNATAAMGLTLRILGVGPGDEVLLPYYSAITAVIYHTDARIVLVDVPGPLKWTATGWSGL